MPSLDDERMAREEPVLSIICSGNRPGKWSKLCDSLKVQQIPFEIVMVGPCPPEGYVPPWFHYYFSVLKPHQCQVAAATKARGKLLCYFNDDWIIDGVNTLGRLVDAWEQCGDERAIVAPHMRSSYPYLSFASEKMGPVLPFGDVFSRQLFLERGGWDKRFIGIYASNDYAIEQQQKKIPVKLCYDIVLDEISEGSLWGELWEHDRSFLDYVWMQGYEVLTPRERTFDVQLRPILKARRLPVVGYDVSAQDLLYTHQGPHGVWQDQCEACWAARQGDCLHVPQLPPDLPLHEAVQVWEKE